MTRKEQHQKAAQKLGWLVRYVLNNPRRSPDYVARIARDAAHEARLYLR